MNSTTTKTRRKPAACGTDSGYFRHLRTTKTEPCDACRAAHSEAEKDRRRRSGKPRRISGQPPRPCVDCGGPVRCSDRCQSCAAKKAAARRRRKRELEELAPVVGWRLVRGVWKAAS